MAAPTNVRVEATSTTTTVLRWSYAGAASVTVYRSTDGVSFAAVSGAVLPPTTLTYTDTGLSPATKYWYKLTDDAGATFSSVVTVWTHVCLDNPDGSEVFALPRFSGEEQDSAQLNDMAQRIEEVLGTRVMEPQQCARCPVDGALVLDCSSGCKQWIVVADEDINSISMQWCDGGDTSIDFVIPPNTTRQICGFDSRFGFSGDECFSAPIVAGSNGRTMTVGGSGPQGNKGIPSASGSKPGYGGGTGRGGGSGCNCVPSGQGVNNLTIKSCNANNSLDCSSAKKLQLKACGGLSPYTWSKTGSVTLSPTTGSTTTVSPPTNSGSAVVGVAYIKRHYICSSSFCSGTNCTNVQAESEIPFSCADVPSPCQAVSGGVAPSGAAVGAVCCPEVGEERCPSGTCAGSGFGPGVNTVTDFRTGPMIAAGCNPCGLNEGATVSVTDSIGTVTTIILTS
jgi:hypothetical protein